YVILALLLAISMIARFADQSPLIAGGPLERPLLALYDYLKDMSLVIVTVIAAYLANVFQKRATFVESLRQEWRGIVQTKSALFSFCESTYPSTDDYLRAYCRISETLDNMRIVYRNVGETRNLIGLYPFAPLHDMRRALATLDPRASTKVSPEQRELVRDAILQGFYALREKFLDELDLEEPSTPLTASVARRLKQSGATSRARRVQAHQQQRLEGDPKTPRPDVDEFLRDLYYREHAATHADAQTSRLRPSA
ncbi:MAG: hypothetical protein AAFV26_12010, partial [Pseudomonadota bacterium]